MADGGQSQLTADAGGEWVELADWVDYKRARPGLLVIRSEWPGYGPVNVYVSDAAIGGDWFDPLSEPGGRR